MRKQPSAGLGPVAAHPTHSVVGPRQAKKIVSVCFAVGHKNILACVFFAPGDLLRLFFVLFSPYYRLFICGLVFSFAQEYFTSFENWIEVVAVFLSS